MSDATKPLEPQPVLLGYHDVMNLLINDTSSGDEAAQRRSAQARAYNMTEQQRPLLMRMTNEEVSAELKKIGLEGIPYETEEDIGHTWVFYSADMNFNGYIRDLTDVAKQTLVQAPFERQVPHRVETEDWEFSNVWEFLYEVEQLRSTKGNSNVSPDEIKALLDKFIPEGDSDPYSFRQSILNLLDTEDDQPLCESMNRLVMAYQGEFEAA